MASSHARFGAGIYCGPAANTVTFLSLPRSLSCRGCGKPFFRASLKIHIKSCPGEQKRIKRLKAERTKHLVVLERHESSAEKRNEVSSGAPATLRNGYSSATHRVDDTVDALDAPEYAYDVDTNLGLDDSTGDGRRACRFCRRRFNHERHGEHIRICARLKQARTGQPPPRVYDSAAARRAGVEAGPGSPVAFLFGMSSPGRGQSSNSESRPGSRRSARPRPGTVGGVGGSFGAAVSPTTAAIAASKAASRAANGGGSSSPFFMNHKGAPVPGPGSPFMRPHTAPDRLVPSPMSSRHHPPPRRGPSPTPSSPVVLLSPIQLPPTTPVRSGRAWSSNLGDVHGASSSDDHGWHHGGNGSNRNSNRRSVHDSAKKPSANSLWTVPREATVPQSHATGNSLPVHSPLPEWRTQLRQQASQATKTAPPGRGKKQWGGDTIPWDEPLSPLSGGVVAGGRDAVAPSSAQLAKVRAKVRISGRWAQSAPLGENPTPRPKSKRNQSSPLPTSLN